MICVRYIYIRLHSEVKCRCLSVKLRFVSNLQRKLNKENTERVSFGRLWLFVGSLWSFAGGLCSLLALVTMTWERDMFILRNSILLTFKIVELTEANKEMFLANIYSSGIVFVLILMQISSSHSFTKRLPSLSVLDHFVWLALKELKARKCKKILTVIIKV